MIKRLKFIFGIIIGVMVGLIAGWLFLFPLYLIISPISLPLTLFLMSDVVPEPWSRVQEPTAIVVGIMSWILIILGGVLGGWLGWRYSMGQPVRSLKDLKSKKLLLVVIALTAVGLMVGGINIVVRLKTPPPVTPLTSTPRQVAIITDKLEYKQGKPIRITVRNGLDESVWYLGDLCDPQCCGVERLKDDNWEPVEKILCILPERGFIISPQKLEAGKEFSQEWEQMKRAKYDTHTFIEPGEYRISFSYGSKESSYEENIIYSNVFIIKEEKEYPTYGKIIDVNLMVHRDNTVTEAEPIEIKMGRPTSSSILKYREGDYLLRVGEKVDRLRIGTVLWSQSFPVDFDYTGPVLKGIDYSEIEYDRVYVSFRIPYEPRMKSLQLWHKDKLIFFKELPKF